MNNYSLKPDQLTPQINAEQLPFESFSDLQVSQEFLGQQRAKRSLSFGLATDRAGYNIFVMGNAGTGRISMAQQFLKLAAQHRQPADDWAYVNNFDEPREPLVIRLPTGYAKQITDDLKTMINRWLVTIPAAFENPAYLRRKAAIEKKFTQQFEAAIDAVEKEANQKEFALYQDATNISFSPIVEGKPVDDITFASLPQDKKDQINQTLDQLEDKLNEALLEMPQWKRESYDAVQELNADTIRSAVLPQIDELSEQYQSVATISQHFASMVDHLVKLILENFQLIESPELANHNQLREMLQQSFTPNALVINNSDEGAPVVYESHPTFANLFGRVEYWSEGGSMATHYQHIQSGALHRANGGYLILEADKVFEDPFIWSQLKRSLQSQQLKLEPPMAEGQTAVSIGMSPQPVPLDVKVILVGTRDYYYMLQENDPEFAQLFRVLVDFDEQLDRESPTILHLARLIKTRCEQQSFALPNIAAFIELIKFSTRLSGHQKKLSAHISEVFELLGEADLARSQRNAIEITAEDIHEALSQREYRHSRIRNDMLSDVIEGQVLINTSGHEVGGINGLTIWEIGSTEFGTPARITATVAPGSKGIVDIERESELGLSIHSKGVLILSGYMANRYATDFPLTISANIVMEQSYGFIDGDSASLAELVALISAISKTPIDQSLAVTGSINQFGEVQAIGGANEKIEGFFGICKARGLTGDQGVIIPAANTKNLVLRREVIDAVSAGQFHIYAVDHIDQAIQVLCRVSTAQLAELHQSISGKLKEMHDVCEGTSDDDDDSSEDIKKDSAVVTPPIQEPVPERIPAMSDTITNNPEGKS